MVGDQLQRNSPIESLGEYENPLIVKALVYNLRQKALMETLDWRKPKPLCKGSGMNWEYQGASKIANSLRDPLVKHFKAWKDGRGDKSAHAMNLVLSGPGTGKSRMLDEMPKLLREAAVQEEDPELLKRIQKAYVFNVTFENATAVSTAIDNPTFEVCYRMLYQLTKEKLDWLVFRHRVKTSFGKVPLTIQSVVTMLAELISVEDVKDITVILCVDGLQKLENDVTKRCAFYFVLAELCRYVNTSEAFAVCVCSATIAIPVENVINSSQQARHYLVPPPLLGEVMVKPTTRLQSQLVDDMGGHGRSLEVLYDWFHTGGADRLEQLNSIQLVDEIYTAITMKYGDIFCIYPFGDPAFCRSVLAAILSRLLMRSLLKSDEVGDFDEQITNPILQFAYVDQFHAGSRLGPISRTQILELYSRRVVETVHQEETHAIMTIQRSLQIEMVTSEQ
ncbi:hypothetical protein P3T76_007138 [Phytophthora citrophthora]|uniref:Crinkler (CRN) family protein n=1 Tax=Phytophthora citrophthora TaxID=4793 RepID=A0AAD9LMY5_9STRA|nr:hypothetical protein P3T76_007138 [Phytophthora citrophthora]